MIKIEEYILLPKSIRQAHLRLHEPCVDRGKCYSYFLKGLLAYILDTTLPSGPKIHVCHACNNDRCSHPYHVYWCTAAENRQDTLEKAKQLQNKARSLGITSKKEKAKETEHSRVQLLTLGGNSTSSNTSFAK